MDETERLQQELEAALARERVDLGIIEEAMRERDTYRSALEWVLSQQSWRDWYYWAAPPDYVREVIDFDNAHIGGDLQLKDRN